MQKKKKKKAVKDALKTMRPMDSKVETAMPTAPCAGFDGFFSDRGGVLAEPMDTHAEHAVGVRRLCGGDIGLRVGGVRALLVELFLFDEIIADPLPCGAGEFVAEGRVVGFVEGLDEAVHIDAKGAAAFTPCTPANPTPMTTGATTIVRTATMIAAATPGRLTSLRRVRWATTGSRGRPGPWR